MFKNGEFAYLYRKSKGCVTESVKIINNMCFFFSLKIKISIFAAKHFNYVSVNCLNEAIRYIL